MFKLIVIACALAVAAAAPGNVFAPYSAAYAAPVVPAYAAAVPVARPYVAPVAAAPVGYSGYVGYNAPIAYSGYSAYPAYGYGYSGFLHKK